MLRGWSVAIAALVIVLFPGAVLATSYKQPGFTESVVFSGLVNPTSVRFLPDGSVIVVEKSGLIKRFDSLTDPTPSVVADLRVKVHNFWDRGLLGLAVDPNFTITNYIYVVYSHDAVIGGIAPKWGPGDGTSDPCPFPPGATTDGCVISGHLSRLTAVGPDWTASEQVLIEDWCQQFPSHSVGALGFGADGMLYLSGGEGASFSNSDWGQFGGTQGSPPPTPKNPCGDPPVPVGGNQTPPTAEGGSLRSQSPRRTAGEPRVLNGSVLRVDPATGAAAPGNPLFGSSDANERRIIGYGFRNPFRMIVKPGTNDVWVADVGGGFYEEIDRVPDLTTARNYGWPCFEGPMVNFTGFNICPPQALTTPPFYTYLHSESVVAGDGCPTGSSSVAGMAFYQGASNYPASYNGALFFSDYSRKCMWVMFPGGNGDPDPTTRAAFASGANGPVDLQMGPDGDLYYVDFDGGRILRVKYGLSAIAVATSPTFGEAPLTVSFDGTGSVPAQPGDTLTYAWDLDGDGQYDDSTASQPSYIYVSDGEYTVRLEVTDQRGAFDISDPITVSVGNQAPTATILTPPSSLVWKVGDTVSFSGSATDPQEGNLGPSHLSWSIIIYHCPSTCHTHVYQTFSGVASGSFPAPDHEYPAYLEIQLTATDSDGLTGTASVSINPQIVDLTLQSAPTGLQLTAGTTTATAPFVKTVIVNSQTGLDAPSPQGAFPNVWDFVSWSDGGAQSHTIVAPAVPVTYTAAFTTHADLSIGMSASPEPVGAGTTLTYTLNVSNAGPSQANAISVSDVLPSGAVFLSAGGTGWSCLGPGPVVCTLPSLGIAAAAPITIQVTAPSSPGTIINNASVTSSTSDAIPGNNSTSVISNVFARADLSITQLDAPDPACASLPITYTLSVSNGGPSDATSITVTDVTPSGTSLVSASGSGWTCSGSTTVTCTRPTLSMGAAPAIAVTVDAPSSPGTATNTASVSSTTSDPSTANNSSSASTTVGAPVAIPVVTAQLWAPVGATGLLASVPFHLGSSYTWTLTGGTITGGQGSEQVTFDAGAPGTTMVLDVTEANTGCVSPAGSAKVQVDFLDAPPSHPFHDFVDTIARNGITVGCGNGNFCTDDPNSRAEMAVFLLKSKFGAAHIPPPATGGVFLDVQPGDFAADWIEEIASLGITGGCDPTHYCPDAPVTRGEMAVFLLKTLLGATYVPPPAANIFVDVPPGYFSIDWIEALYNRNITAGCIAVPLSYCPDDPNTRGQMAVFLTLTFGLI